MQDDEVNVEIVPAENRDKTGKFVPGASGNPAGNHLGTKHKATQEVREASRRLVEDPIYRANLKARLDAGTAGPMETLLWKYAYGEPSKTPDGAASVINVAVFKDLSVDELRVLQALARRAMLPEGEQEEE
jgi:hypothetical protein